MRINNGLITKIEAKARFCNKRDFFKQTKKIPYTQEDQEKIKNEQEISKCHNLGFPYVTQRNDSIPFNELNITYYKKGSSHIWKKSITDMIHVHQKHQREK